MLQNSFVGGSGAQFHLLLIVPNGGPGDPYWLQPGSVPDFTRKNIKKSAFHCHLRELIYNYPLNPFLGVLLNLTGVVSLLGNATLPKYQWGSKSTKNFQTWFIEANFDLCSSRAQEDAKQYFFGKVSLDIKMVNPWPHKDRKYRSKYLVVSSWELSRKKQSKMRHPVRC